MLWQCVRITPLLLHEIDVIQTEIFNNCAVENTIWIFFFDTVSLVTMSLCTCVYVVKLIVKQILLAAISDVRSVIVSPTCFNLQHTHTYTHTHTPTPHKHAHTQTP